MGRMPSDDQHAAHDFRTLPEPVRIDDTVTTQVTHEAPNPTSGRDADTEWLLRYGGG